MHFVCSLSVKIFLFIIILPQNGGVSHCVHVAL